MIHGFNMEKIGVIGLGYVGLPVALEFDRAGFEVVGFDVNKDKIAKLRVRIDPINEKLDDLLAESRVHFSNDPKALTDCSVYIVCVPTPVDQNKSPDLSHLREACKTVGAVIKRGDLVVVESTVYPGVTEEFCGKIISDISGLKATVDFSIGYSPERMNPGDPTRRLPDIIKVVAGDTENSLKRVKEIYSKVIKAGVFCATSIKVAEASKVIENTQRDLNIALMNELAMIFEKVGISTREVLEAAKTKWNFLPFVPGLVGGHCIGVDPYYLTTMAERFGYHPEIILAGRRINDRMGSWIGQKIVKLLIQQEIAPKGSEVGILGLTFKENVSDLRNSKVVDLIRELEEFGANVTVWDPHVTCEEAEREYGFKVTELDKQYDCLILAVSHNEFKNLDFVKKFVKRGGIVADLKGIFSEASFKEQVYWSL